MTSVLRILFLICFAALGVGGALYIVATPGVLETIAGPQRAETGEVSASRISSLTEARPPQAPQKSPENVQDQQTPSAEVPLSASHQPSAVPAVWNEPIQQPSGHHGVVRASAETDFAPEPNKFAIPQARDEPRPQPIDLASPEAWSTFEDDAAEQTPMKRKRRVANGRPRPAPAVRLTQASGAIEGPQLPLPAERVAQRNDSPLGGADPQMLNDVMSLLGKINQGVDSAGPAPTDAVPSPSDLLRSAPAEAIPPPADPQSNLIEPKAEIHPGEGDEGLSITIQGADIREVLELLSEQGGLNILTTQSVKGTVSASLNDVDLETALEAILKTTGFVWRRLDGFIMVGTPADFDAMDRAQDHLATRLFHVNYVKASELQNLITPILTPGIGAISVSSPAEIGIAPDGNTAGGDSFAGREALLVRDFESVLLHVEEIVREIDRRPAQVAIEAMILSVEVNDENKLGVSFEALRNQDTIRLVSGTPLQDLDALNITEGGLKVAFLDSSLSLLVEALETVGDVNIIATPRLTCLNKHRAEILIGEQLGYVSTTQTETSTTQSVEFLEVGTQLRLRPFISSEGLIRMEVHPELSQGNVRVEDGFTLPNKKLTQVTTNIMIRDGCTVVIGGLMSEELRTDARQIPYFGAAPIIGPLFRQKTEETKRVELLVLITPRIICEPDVCIEGEASAAEFHHRQAIYEDLMTPLGKRYQGRKYFRLAQRAWAAGNRADAMRLINLAIFFDPSNRAAIDLRADIWDGQEFGNHTLLPPPPKRGPQDFPPGGELLGPELIEELPGAGEVVAPGEELPDWLLDRMGGESAEPAHSGENSSDESPIEPYPSTGQ